jgi:nucleoside-triphosphatase
MEPARKNLLLTGRPGVGKTTLIKKLSEALKPSHPVGFYTDEIREGGVRKGFELVTLDGRRQILSHVGIKGPFRVGKYGVDIAGFETFFEAIDFLSPATRLVIIDEIGKMECLSGKFRTLLREILNSQKSLIATIALKGGGIIAEIKGRRETTLLEVTAQNRDSILSEVLMSIRR